MKKDHFQQAFGELRLNISNLVEILQKSHPDAPWKPESDCAFWKTFDEIELIGQRKDLSRSKSLMDLALIGDPGPMGRDMFLSQAALIAIPEMPEAAHREFSKITSEGLRAATPYLRHRFVALFDALGLEEMPPRFAALLISDPDIGIRSQYAVREDK